MSTPLKCKFCDDNIDSNLNLFRKYYPLNKYGVEKDTHGAMRKYIRQMDIDCNLCYECMKCRCYVCLKDYDDSFVDIEFKPIEFDIVGGKFIRNIRGQQVEVDRTVVNILNMLYEKLKHQYVCISCFPYMKINPNNIDKYMYSLDFNNCGAFELDQGKANITHYEYSKSIEYFSQSNLQHGLPNYLNNIQSNINYLMRDYYTFKKQMLSKTTVEKKQIQGVKPTIELLEQADIVERPEHCSLDDEYMEKYQIIKQHSKYAKKIQSLIDTTYDRMVADMKAELVALTEAKKALSITVSTPTIAPMVKSIDDNISRINSFLKSDV